MYDVIIVGAGPAGLSAALYATRRALKTLVLTKNLGGQTAMTLNMENYPGVPEVAGVKLMEEFKSQAEKYGAEIKFDAVTGISKDGNGFKLTSESGDEYNSKAVLLAFGKTPRKLDVPGEQEFLNKGVVYCATCDAPLFGGKDVAVIGGGSSAVDAALLLAKIANKVYLIHRRDEFRAEDILVDRVKQESKIGLVLNSTVEAIKGDAFVGSIDIKEVKTNKTSSLDVQGVFVEIGYKVNTEMLKDLIDLNETGEVIVDEHNQTSLPGVFAAGDITTVPYKQTIISAGEGAKAALSIYNYINKLDR